MSMANSAWADPEADKSGVADRVILEADEIDSSTVPVDSYVVVIHGQGERHPVSGEYEQLVTSRGYVHAVDAEVLTLFRRWDGEPEWIAVEQIQTLVLMGSPSLGVEAGKGPADPVSSKAKSSSLGHGNGDSTRTGVEKKGTAAASLPSVHEPRDSKQVDPGRARRNLMETRTTLLRTKRGGDTGADKRIANKLAAGALGGSWGDWWVLGLGLPWSKRTVRVKTGAIFVDWKPHCQACSLERLELRSAQRLG